MIRYFLTQLQNAKHAQNYAQLYFFLKREKSFKKMSKRNQMEQLHELKNLTFNQKKIFNNATRSTGDVKKICN